MIKKPVEHKHSIRDGEYFVKIAFVIVGFLGMVGLIIADYFWHLIFDPNNFDVTKWLNRAIFNGSINIVGMILGFIACLETLKSKENGKYQKRLAAFGKWVEDLCTSIKIVYFDQFIDWYAEKELRRKKIKHLTMHGMPRMDAEVIVDYASLRDIPTLCGLKLIKTNKVEYFFTKNATKYAKPTGEYGEDVLKVVDGKEILLPAIKDSDAPYVEEVLNGTITVQQETSAYYTSVGKNRDKNLSALELPMATERDRVHALKFSFVSKVLIGLIYITLLSFLIVENSEGAGTSDENWNMALRFISLTLGIGIGVFIAFIDIKYEMKELGEKMRIGDRYDQNLLSGEFVPITYADSAKERIKACKEKMEKAKAEIVDAPIKIDNVPRLEQKEDNTILPPLPKD